LEGPTSITEENGGLGFWGPEKAANVPIGVEEPVGAGRRLQVPLTPRTYKQGPKRKKSPGRNENCKLEQKDWGGKKTERTRMSGKCNWLN